jgi:hypothetical protein
MSSLLAPLTYGGSITLWTYIAQVEHTILEKQDNYQKQTQRNRLYIHGANGKLMLSIPVKHLGYEGHQKYKDVLVDNSFPWQSQHWKSLQTAYRSSPYFEFYEDEFSALYVNKYTHLYSFNQAVFSTICLLIGLTARVRYTECYEQSSSHLDIRFLQQAKKKHPNTPVTYTQVFSQKNGFIKNLSLLDLLFNEGPNTLSLLQKASLPKITYFN